MPGLNVPDTVRRSRWVVLAIVVLLLSTVGIWNGWDEWPDADSTGQTFASITEIGYGVLGMIGAFAVHLRWTGTRTVLWIWALCLGTTAGLAPVVWGGSPAWVGVLSGVSAGLLGVAVIWMSKRQGIPQ